MNWDCVDLCCYINLKHKEDQKKNIENELKKIGFPSEKIKRIEATYRPLNGYQGNCLSHLDAINYAIDIGAKNLLLLEDDITFLRSGLEIIHFIENCQNLFHNNWDVLMLGCDIGKYEDTLHPMYKRILIAGLEHAHLINGHYLEKMAHFYVWAYENILCKEPFLVQSIKYKSNTDNLWQILMKKDNWIVGCDSYAEQKDHNNSLSLPCQHKWIQRTVKHPGNITNTQIPDHWDISTLPID